MSSDGSNGSLPAPKEPAKRPATTDEIRNVIFPKASEGQPPLQTSDAEADTSAPSSPPWYQEPGREAENLASEDLEEAEDPQPKKGAAQALRDFAKEHGMTVKQLMRLEVDFPGEDEAPVTIGELKDRWRESRQFETTRNDFENWHDTAQNEVMVARNQVQEIFQRLTHLVPPETMAHILSDMEVEQRARTEKARAQLLEWYPEFRDAQHLVAARTQLTDFYGKRYGISAREIGGMQDPRLIKIAMDFMRFEARRERAAASGKVDMKPTLTRPAAKGRTPSIDERAKALKAAGKVDEAIALIIREGQTK